MTAELWNLVKTFCLYNRTLSTSTTLHAQHRNTRKHSHKLQTHCIHTLHTQHTENTLAHSHTNYIHTAHTCYKHTYTHVFVR
uniref:Uncharacterized protein n=1 Tax=Anguilla anguilla TaxID=7936 RepID=A0A0E9WC19_ANGAN